MTSHCCAMVLLLGACLATSCVSHTESRWIEFPIASAGERAGAASVGAFEACSGDWKSVEAADAPSPPHVLLQDAEPGEGDFNLCLLTGPSLDSGSISVRFKAISGRFDQGGGLVWRAQDAANYYLTRFNPLESNLRLYVVRGGKREQLASVDCHPPAGWHALTVDFDDDTITVRLDGVASIEQQQAAQLGAGRIGVWTKADARTQFDDLVWRN